MKKQMKTLMVAITCLALPAISIAQQPLEIPQGQDEPVVISPKIDRSPSRLFSAPGDQAGTQDQTVLLNSKYAGWQEAGIGTNGDRLSKDLRANWIMVDANGSFMGKVIPGEGAEISNMYVYLMNLGRLVKETAVSAEDGTFQFDNVREGLRDCWLGSQGLFCLRPEHPRQQPECGRFHADIGNGYGFSK